MVKFLAYLSAFLGAICAFLYFMVSYKDNKIKTLSAEKITINESLTRCKNEVEKNSQAKERAEKTIGEIRTVVKTVPSICDCYNSAIDGPIVGRVRGE